MILRCLIYITKKQIIDYFVDFTTVLVSKGVVPCTIVLFSGDNSEGSHVEFEIDVPAGEPSTNRAAAGALTEAYQLLSKTATE